VAVLRNRFGQSRPAIPAGQIRDAVREVRVSAFFEAEGGTSATSHLQLLVRAAGIEPARAFARGFSYHFDFRRRPFERARDVRE
jgi:hypothetical protein